MSHYIDKQRLALGEIESNTIKVHGLIAAMPQFAYPLPRSFRLVDKPYLHIAQAYQESPVWDWVGDLLARV
jgi:hypothetical protein